MKRNAADLRMEKIIGHLLRVGVLLSAAVVLVGGALFLRNNAGTLASYHDFRGEPLSLRTLSGIVHSAGSGDPAGIMQLGLVLLIATPIVRVMFSAVAFGFEHDRMYVFITLVVLAVLLYSLAGQ